MFFKLNEIRKKFNDISLMYKVNITGIIIILLFTIIIYLLILPLMEREKLNERSGKLKAVVNSAVSLIDHYEKSVRKQEWSPDSSMPRTIDEAKNRIIRRLRDMRYDKTEFFFILDGDGNMIMHPLKPELEGRNMMDVEDTAGIHLFREMVMNSQKDGETFVRYWWESKYSPAITEPQLTYAKYYWQWDWVVCSSLYIQDITDAMKDMRIRSALYEAIAAAAAMALLFILVHFSLNKQLKKLLSGIKEIHNGNLNHRINISSNDEVGFISAEFNSMVNDLNSSRENLIKSEKKYREMADMLPDIIYEADGELRITYLNKAGYDITGYNFEDVERGFYLDNIIDKNDLTNFVDVLRKGEKDKYFSKHKLYKKSGSYFYGENSMNIFYENGKVVLLRGSIRDISEKQKFEEQIMQSQKMETIGTLAGGLAHDFNNVLSGIVSTISLMKYEIQQDSSLPCNSFNSYIEIMEKSGQRAADMVQQLLTLSRKKETEFMPVDLTFTIKNVKNICDNTLDKSISINMDIKPQKAIIHADPTQMEQVLLNLCVNAGHAMTVMKEENENKGGRLDIALDIIHADSAFCEAHPEAEEKDYWMLTVGDTGIGMDSQTIAQIFVPFFTTKEKGMGTGLGLSMVYNIIHQHNGFINVYSEKGVGSTFNIYLPALSGSKSHKERIIEKHIYRGQGTILVIDDEEIIRRIAKNILKKCGYTVITASSGDEGIHIFSLKHKEISGVILDLAMPKKSGDQVYDDLKKIDGDVKVILASGFRQDERVESALQKGISLFIQKPYTMEKLADAVHTLLIQGKGSGK
jgi:PAS domain S-box-containing protein